MGKTLVLLVISIAVLLMNSYIGYVIITHQLDPQNAALIGGVQTGASSLAVMVISYWFGSSKGSADKDQMISDLTINPQDTQEKA